MKRVVVTGMSAITPLGNDWASFAANLQSNHSGIRYIEDWQKYRDLCTKLAAPVADFQLPAHYTRKQTRSMGRVAKLAVRATELALQDAKLLDSEL
nr:beta-ketoacyl-ACP synthase [Cellvibrionaceae bacterium]